MHPVAVVVFLIVGFMFGWTPAFILLGAYLLAMFFIGVGKGLR